MKIAIVHEWFSFPAGSEKVVQQLLLLYPQADLFALVDFLDEKDRGIIFNKPVRTSFIQHLPWAKTKFRQYLPLMPLAIEQFDLSAYDIIISSSHAIAKGVLVGPDQLHISYVHSPIRYAWDMQHQYLRDSGLKNGIKGILAKTVLHKIRLWDTRTANGVDGFIANSAFVARRIQKTYRRNATIIYPPVDVASCQLTTDKEQFYLTASRLVPYKKNLLVVEAFNAMPERKLIVIGSGPDYEKIKGRAGPNIVLLGYQPDSVLKDYMQRAAAFVFAGEEDFGIMAVEAQACGTPVIAFGKGGLTETVLDMKHDNPTGLFFEQQTVSAIVDAVEKFEKHRLKFSPEACHVNAQRFHPQYFRETFHTYLMETWSNFKMGIR